ncbi:hypothetical protein DASC09_004860 [Saccharomycopsis crataegensis]|uniref:1,3-beta-glucan synthase n=1 Tax=Saccharomycopsis crataegensis TaxID=43959 RepID=A0AAV5QES8_9ASCO|nr:hypothetical protein DASC09_004860 [Saccharomycopsis crataegensis]
MGQSPEHQTTDETRYPGFSQGQSDSGSSHYTDSPEFQIPDSTIDNNREKTNHFAGSALTERTTQLFSGFKTPKINSSKWWNQQDDNEVDKDEALIEEGVYHTFNDYYDPYPNWSYEDDSLPIARKEIGLIFMRLTEVFEFQMDNAKNMFDYLLRLLDSRASRMKPLVALKSLHADYIGGENSNFKKWYFAAQLDIDDLFGYIENSESLKSYSFEEAERTWKSKMHDLSPTDCIIQLSLYLLCWGEAGNVRFMPECLCFIFKCCNDYYYSLDSSRPPVPPPSSFLEHVIIPLYNYYRDQNYEVVEGKYVKRSKDHASIIGYDDINQFFWYRKGLLKLPLKNEKTKFMEQSKSERYLRFCDINWSKAFYKTYRETRTWNHLIVNFNRIWIIHCCMFWYYISFNSPTLYTKNYQIQLDTQPSVHTTLSTMAISGSIACLINIVATIHEFTFVPRRWSGAEPLTRRFLLLSLIFIVNTVPSIYVFGFLQSNRKSNSGTIISSFQFIVSIITVCYFSFTPLGKLFRSYWKDDNKHTPTKVFTDSVHNLQGRDRISSYGLWAAIFVAKFLESYFFLVRSMRDPIRELSNLKITHCSGDLVLGSFICQHQPKILLLVMFVTDLLLFFLDTYLWYIIWTTVFSVCRSFYMGVSILTPWKNIFSRLPKRIFSKIICSYDKALNPKFSVSQIWNSIIIAMYREHLLSLEHVEKLIYQEVMKSGVNDVNSFIEPTFFVSQEDRFVKFSVSEGLAEAQRRITFFAQSLSTFMPEPCSISEMPTFSVLIPHYSENILLTLKEIIREEDEYAHITLLEYLKQLHPMEWDCFVQDTKILVDETEISRPSDNIDGQREHYNNLPYYCVGFKSATPEYILRTRIWASLRSQTLYRTISGFMNYSRAIKLLYDVENPNLSDFDDSEVKKYEAAAIMALRKFRIVVSMQRLVEFSAVEEENKDFLLRAYPELQISYLDKEIDPDTGIIVYYTSLMDGSCEIDETGNRIPKYRIKLPGNPILGDGKSDNQNNSLIFCRGEYIQLIDANQDNYLEECLKIRNVLAEFEEKVHPIEYSIGSSPYEHPYNSPIAIIGTREYIFSENIGILGDVAAGKEQTFGTLFARTLAQIGGKLHYGHPDFLNNIFMTTRGGVSKAQKGLHLNEDIYAGMTTILRGGRIKHCEYIQCGKGRELGFGSILNFTTKIGAGMGEQMLSREYFYLGTQLPLDRFLSFYYGHPGFHLNNVFIILSVKLLLLVTVNLSSLFANSVICEYNRYKPHTDPRKPAGCYNIEPINNWLKTCVLSIFVVFGISFVPLCVQELMERGIWKALSRLSKHFASLSPLFEVFVCKIYAQSLINDLAVGGAKYISTGRGFATIRVPFSVIYSRFASESLYFGALSSLLIVYCTGVTFNISTFWFWITVNGLCLSPFVFNPNQFYWNDFFLDYKNYLKWLSSGNSQGKKDSWIKFTRELRSQITGSKKKSYSKPGDKLSLSFRKPSMMNIFLDQICAKLVYTMFVLTAFLFASSHKRSRNPTPSAAIARIIIATFAPIFINMVIALSGFTFSLLFGPIFGCCCTKFPSSMAFVTHSLGFINHIIFFEIFWFLEEWNFTVTILGYAVCIMLQDLFFKMITLLFITRELQNNAANRAWWSGTWLTSGLGFSTMTQPIREYLCKTMELSLFVNDFVLGHILLFVQFPILLIPGINQWHSLMLFWLKPSKQIRPQILTTKQRRSQGMVVMVFLFVFLLIMNFFVLLLLVPFIVNEVFEIDLYSMIPENIILLMD